MLRGIKIGLLSISEVNTLELLPDWESGDVCMLAADSRT
jgi:hypothetical protein